MNMFVVLLIVVAIGALLGLLNGTIITLLKVPPFITTLGTQTIVYGLCLVVTDAQPIGGFQKSFIDLINGRIGNSNGFHLPYLLFVAAVFGPVLLVPVQQDAPRQVHVRHRRQRGRG